LFDFHTADATLTLYPMHAALAIEIA
jgi:hypothetical protein